MNNNETECKTMQKEIGKYKEIANNTKNNMQKIYNAKASGDERRRELNMHKSWYIIA